MIVNFVKYWPALVDICRLTVTPIYNSILQTANSFHLKK